MCSIKKQYKVTLFYKDKQTYKRKSFGSASFVNFNEAINCGERSVKALRLNKKQYGECIWYSINTTLKN